MKQLILFYSHGGNNRQLAQFIGKRYHIETAEILEKRKKRTMFTTMLDFIFSRKPKLQPLTPDLSSYDHIMLVAPIWMGRVAAPMLSALNTYGNDIKSYSFFTFSGGPEESQEKFTEVLESTLNKKAETVLTFAIQDLLSEEQKKDPKNVMQFKANETQISAFTPDLDKVLN